MFCPGSATQIHDSDVVYRMINRGQLAKLCLCVVLLVIITNLFCYRNLYLLNRLPVQSHSKNQLITQTRLANLSIHYPDEIQEKFTERRMKKVVWYDIFNDGHGLRNKGRLVNYKLCPYYKNCIRVPDFIPNSPKRDEEQLKEVDAVIFQGIHYAAMKHRIPRSPGQIFVFAEREPGWLIGCDNTYNDVKYRNIFNWTMTFRRDSDVPMLYGQIFSKKDKKVKLLTEEGRLAKRRSNAKILYGQIFGDKDLEVVWLVSHCKTFSFREEYVAELQKYIPVDIIGGCGKSTCPKSNNMQCLATITKRYKFILSFENSFQTDYVTEKLFDWFPRNIIQVVFGLADYTNLVPHGTVINAANFVSPNHLANYLKDVGSSKQKYTRYLMRKSNYFAVGHTEMQQRAFCKLCEKLNTVDSNRKTYTNIAKWWQAKNVSLINKFVVKKVTNTIGKCDETR